MTPRPLTIRLVTPADTPACTLLLRDAFWNVYHPGATEHLIWQRIAGGHPDALPEQTFVAVLDGRIVGCTASTRARIVPAAPPGPAPTPVVVLGPIAVAPAHQRSGIGRALIAAAISTAADAGERGIFLYGDPAYYGRFGFEDARRWGITTPDGQNLPAFMGRELHPGSLAGLSGRLLESDVYAVDPVELDAFDARFPPREKKVLPGQL